MRSSFQGEGGTCSNNYKHPIQRYDPALVPNANSKDKIKVMEGIRDVTGWAGGAR